MPMASATPAATAIPCTEPPWTTSAAAGAIEETVECDRWDDKGAGLLIVRHRRRDGGAPYATPRPSNIELTPRRYVSGGDRTHVRVEGWAAPTVSTLLGKLGASLEGESLHTSLDGGFAALLTRIREQLRDWTSRDIPSSSVGAGFPPDQRLEAPVRGGGWAEIQPSFAHQRAGLNMQLPLAGYSGLTPVTFHLMAVGKEVWMGVLGERATDHARWLAQLGEVAPPAPRGRRGPQSASPGSATLA